MHNQHNYKIQPSRLIFDNIFGKMQDLTRLSGESDQIKTELTNRLSKRQQELSEKIRQADLSGSTPEQLKNIAKQEAEKMLEEEMNKLLLERNYSITYKDLESYPQMQDAKNKLNQEVDRLVSQFYADKAAASNRVAQGLSNLPSPPPTSPSSPPLAPLPPLNNLPTNPNPIPSAPNAPSITPPPATSQLNVANSSAANPINFPNIPLASPNASNNIAHAFQTRESTRQKIVISQQLEQKKTLTSQLPLQINNLKFDELDRKVSNLTDPDAQNAIVPDYEGWDIVGLIGETNKQNQTRSILNGYLLAGYVFTFDGKSSKGDSMSDDIMFGNQVKSIKGVKEIYESSDGGHFYKDKAFTMEHLKTDLGLSKYLDEAKNFNPKSDKVTGLVAGLLKYAESIPDKKMSDSYTKIIRDALSRSNFKEATTEQQQISFIFSEVKSFELYKNNEVNRLSLKLSENAIQLYQKLPSFTLDESKVGGVYSFLTTGKDPILDNSSSTFEQKFTRIKNLEAEMVGEFISSIEKRNEQYRNTFLEKFSTLRQKNNNLIRKVVTEEQLNEYAKIQYSLQSEYLHLNPKAPNDQPRLIDELIAAIKGETLKINSINQSLESLVNSQYVAKYYEGENKIIELIGLLDNKIQEADTAASQE